MKKGKRPFFSEIADHLIKQILRNSCFERIN